MDNQQQQEQEDNGGNHFNYSQHYQNNNGNNTRIRSNSLGGIPTDPNWEAVEGEKRFFLKF